MLRRRVIGLDDYGVITTGSFATFEQTLLAIANDVGVLLTDPAVCGWRLHVLHPSLIPTSGGPPRLYQRAIHNADSFFFPYIQSL